MWPKESNSDRVQPPSAGLLLGAVEPSKRPVKKPVLFGKYYLLERINVGGMAEVFRAKAFGVEGFERLVAVKRILPNIAEDKEFIRMFIEEAKLAVQLNHANIAQIFDLGVVDNSYYIALEHVHGRDLRGIFDKCRQLGETMPVAQACFMIMKLCEGLDYAHNKRDQGGRELQLVHRDVSPQNVLISFEGEVKVIDFGIAKAAGKGSKTQAGILKGKFGYMSPEQVRGLPVDRRSDVFSTGIVLYELLTGERLFVGESDFSTLEKVRNVEILPPSTYNRRIPDELERIVLKALTKDVEDRYQNAIDLHDELQAFVYTAGEFYSRKDLAGWMKRTFGKEIEDETAKLESYRQLKPPPAEAPPVVARTATGKQPVGAPPPRRSTQSMAAAGTKPPPPPTRASGPISVHGVQGGQAAAGDRSGDDLAWDDDELETQIYDNPEEEAKAKAAKAAGANGKVPAPVTLRGTKALPLEAPVPTPAPTGARATGAMAAAAVTAADGLAAASGGPDLSSLSSSGKGWEAASPSATLSGMGALTEGSGRPNGKLATGSHPVPAPGRQELRGRESAASATAGRSMRISDPIGAVGMFDEPPAASYSAPFDPMASFGAGIAQRKRSTLPYIVGGAVVVAVAAVVIILASGKPAAPVVATAPTTPTAAVAATPSGPAPVPAVDTSQAAQDTGFDLYVTPAGITNWKLDGEARTDRLPSRIRGITAGAHTVQIDPPPGFMSQNQQVTVDKGKAPRVDITLSPITGITGSFESTPPGAAVSLIVDGKRQGLGPSPATAPLDPRHTYQVLFEKAGYVSVNKPIVFDGAMTERLVVPLEKIGAGTDAVAAVSTPATGPITSPVQVPAKDPKAGHGPKPRHGGTPLAGGDPTPVVEKPIVEKPVVEKPIVEKPVAAKGEGTLTLGSKPPCEIYIDGAATGQHTPQRDIKLPAGKHRITLVNNEYGIKESFSVDVKADEPTKMIKDYSDKLPK